MKPKELRALSTEDLLQKEKAFKKELFDLKCLKESGGVEKPSRFKTLRRDIARIFTIVKERKSDGAKD